MTLARTLSLLCALAPAALATPSAAVAAVTDVRVTPALPSAGDAIHATFTIGLGCNEPAWAEPVVSSGLVLLAGTYPGGEDCPSQADRTFTRSLGPLPAGDYRLRVELLYEANGFVDSGEYALHVEPASEVLELHVGGQLFHVEVGWVNARQGASGVGHPVRQGDLAGYFWLFDPQLTEVTVKIVDGRSLNGHFWLFAGTMTSVEATVTVRRVTGSHCLDTGTCETWTAVLEPDSMQGVADVEAF
jgi:hypothetical protein